MYIAFFVLDETNLKSKYCQTCNKTKSKSGLIGQVTSWKRFNPYEIWPFNTGDCLIEVTTLAGLTVYIHDVIITLCVHKMKNKNRPHRQSNRKIVERVKVDTPNTQIHDL